MWGTVGGADGAHGAVVVRCGRTRAHAGRGTGQGVRARGRRTPRAGHHPGGAMVRAERWSRGTGAVRWDVRAQRGTSRATPRGGAVEHEPSGGFRCADVLWCWWYAAVGRGPRVGTRGRTGPRVHSCPDERAHGRTCGGGAGACGWCGGAGGSGGAVTVAVRPGGRAAGPPGRSGARTGRAGRAGGRASRGGAVSPVPGPGPRVRWGSGGWGAPVGPAPGACGRTVQPTRPTRPGPSSCRGGPAGRRRR